MPNPNFCNGQEFVKEILAKKNIFSMYCTKNRYPSRRVIFLVFTVQIIDTVTKRGIVHVVLQFVLRIKCSLSQ